MTVHCTMNECLTDAQLQLAKLMELWESDVRPGMLLLYVLVTPLI